MSRLIIAALVLVLSTGVVAETRLAAGGWSHHWWSSNNVTNSNHKILGIEHDGYSFGKFDNSYGRETYFIARNWRTPIAEDVNFTASLGVSKGYRTCYGDDESGSNICPHGYIGFEYDRYRIVPSIKIQPGVVVFSPEIKF